VNLMQSFILLFEFRVYGRQRLSSIQLSKNPIRKLFLNHMVTVGANVPWKPRPLGVRGSFHTINGPS
jgi:hypothetical protein